MVLQVIGVKMWFKGWKLAKMHIWSLPVHSSALCAIDHTAIEPSREDRVHLHASTQSQDRPHCDRAHATSAAYHVLPYPPSLHALCHGDSEQLHVIERTFLWSSIHRATLECIACDWAHPWLGSTFKFLINRTFPHFRKLTFGGALKGLKPLCSSL